jgi:hypothetical protein
MNTTAKTLEQLRCIGEVICVGGSGHRRFTIIFVLFVPSSRRSYAQKKKHGKHLMTKSISQSSQVSVCGTYYTLLNSEYYTLVTSFSGGGTHRFRGIVVCLM